MARETRMSMEKKDKGLERQKASTRKSPRSGNIAGKRGREKKKGFTVSGLTPFIDWLLSADSNHGPDG